MKKETIFKHELNESIQANAALNCLNNRNNHKQLNETSDFDARFEFRKDLRELASPAAKKAYMIIRKQYGDSMWRQLGMDDCDEQGLIDMLNMYAEDGLKPQQIVNKMMGVQEQEETDYTNDEIPSPNFSHRMSFMVWAMRNIIPYLKETSQVCAQADPTELKHAVMKILKTRDTGTPETPRSCKEWAKENYDWVEMELNGEYDDYQKKWSKPFNITPSITSEQEEMPKMERDDIKHVLTQYLDECWIDASEDGDLEDLYYAVSDYLDSTGDYPASTSWQDCKPWCQKHYQEIENLFLGGSLS
jgi:hypothetical protein